MPFFGFVLLVLPFYLIWKYSPILFVLLLVAFVVWILYIISESNERARELKEMIAKMSPDERAAYDKKIEDDRLQREKEAFIFVHGEVNHELICPHCQKKGTVHSKNYTENKVSKGKVGGILKTNINMSQAESGIRRRCNNCGSQWNVQ